MAQTQVAAWTTFRVPPMLPNDTEESIVGTEWHQEAIGALADMLRAVAERRSADWGVCEQVALSGLRYPSGHPYDPRPDVMVLARPLPGGGGTASVPLDVAGLPLFIAEVASDSTVKSDVGDKRQVYEAVGVPEYIVFDAVGGVLPEPLRAWRLEGAAYVPWQPEADGWWHSRALDVAFQATRPFLGVRDRDGTLIERSSDVRRHARQLEQHARHLEQRLSQVEEERDTLARRLAEEARQRAELEAQVRRLQGEGGPQSFDPSSDESSQGTEQSRKG